jgi:hypothetical protein
MGHFYGTVQGNRGEASRMGSKNSGMETYCASWKGAIRCFAYVNSDGKDCIRVEMTSWRGVGEYKLLYDGLIGEYKPND